MASKLKDFLASLEPVWEDPREFEWLRNRQTQEIRTDYFEANRFPGLKMMVPNHLRNTTFIPMWNLLGKLL